MAQQYVLLFYTTENGGKLQPSIGHLDHSRMIRMIRSKGRKKGFPPYGLKMSKNVPFTVIQQILSQSMYAPSGRSPQKGEKEAVWRGGGGGFILQKMLISNSLSDRHYSCTLTGHGNMNVVHGKICSIYLVKCLHFFSYTLCVQYNFKLITEAGKAGEVICHTADKEKANHIVMGCRGLGTVRRTLLGSVSDYCLHHSTVPVSVVPASQQ